MSLKISERKPKRDYAAIAAGYEADVISGAVPACRFVKDAVERNQRDRRTYETAGLYVFDDAEAARVCRFVELLTHTKGALAGQKIRLEPWQVWILTTIFGWRRRADGGRRFRRVFIEVPRGNGKALALDTLIPTPNGLVRMGDLRVGDAVYGSDGKPCRITAATDVMIGRPCYEVEFSTGEIIVADAEHQWVTDSRRDRDRLKGRDGKHAGPKSSIKTTEEIAASVMCRREHNHRINVVRPVAGAKQDFELDPYLLGLWLGDGTAHGSGFTCNDPETIDRIRSYGYEVKKSGKAKYAWRITTGSKGKYSDKNSFYKKLQRLGVLGNKHIPEAYMNASAEQRLELLRGLMDTDGYISSGQGQCEFVQKSELLARQVYCLIASLGLRPRILTKDASVGGKSCGHVYRILFHAYRETPVFKLTRKLERMKARPEKRGLQNYRHIVRCDPIPSVPVRCIEVDSADHCYLASEGHIITHNSALSSGVALYCLLADREPGAEVYSFATTRDQAKIVFGDAKQMALANQPLRAQFGLEVLANSLYVPRTNSTFHAKSAEGSTLDGLNTHFACIDELHAHKTRAVYDVVETSMGKRLNSLLWVITTAGFDTAGICYEVRTMVREVLKQTAVDETQFGVIYTIDDDDDWTSVEALRKANPNWGVSVMPDVVLPLQQKAITLASAANNFKTKHLDVWCSAGSAWMDMQAWNRASAPVELSDWEGRPVVIGLDLGAKNDLTAKVLVFPHEREDGRTGYYVSSQFYLPQAAVEKSTNSQYSGWVEEGWIKVSGGAMTDLAMIEEEIREDLSNFEVSGIAYDPWHATQLVTSLDEDGAPMIEFRNTVSNMSDPMKSLEALVQDGRLTHDGNPVMSWMMGNVVAKLDAKDNIFPRKERYEQKIDGPVALIMALGCALVNAEDNSFAEFAENPDGTFFEW